MRVFRPLAASCCCSGRRQGAPEVVCFGFFFDDKVVCLWFFLFFFVFFATSSSIVAFVATSDATLTVVNTPKYTVRRKGARHWSAEDTPVNNCNSVQRCVIRVNIAGAMCMIGRMCHHASTYSHRDAHGTVVSHLLLCAPSGEEAGRCAARLSNIVCVICDMSVFGVVESVVEQLRSCCSNAFHREVQASKKNCQFAKYTQRSNAPRKERFACKCTAPEAQYMQRRAKNELRNMRGRIEASQRFLPHARIVSAKGQAKLFSPSSRIWALRCLTCIARVCQDPDN